MLSGKFLLCAVLVAAWREGQSASLPGPPARFGSLIMDEAEEVPSAPVEVREGVPPPLCAGRCASPPAGPVCAFDATGTARTFATLCEWEAVSCRESTYYAITSLGEC